MTQLTHKHRMVKMTMTPVSVAGIDSNGEPVIYIDPEVAAQAEAASVIGCADCEVGLHQAAEVACTPVSS